ncbi:putative Cytosolic Protein [Alkalibacterium sp. AK22]|uniref:YlbG family protein n=1 Tax=Alkalibacterium sp. AK22 TaxID=1229520 RepID=UPI00045178A1|nr:YlbG family protein [Alkalibacterium sp. AK22]EXJ22786.1 putative Cytosolic Protein [Alkalibacterium sp. AK22]
MEIVQSERVGLVVWLYTTKYVNKLKKYGLVHYVSRNMNYAIVYVDRQDRESLTEVLGKLHFVRKVENSYQCELPKTFDGVLEQVEAMNSSETKMEHIF